MSIAWRLAPSFIVALLCASAAHAQVAPKIVPEPCREVQNASVRDLDRRIASLQAKVGNLKKTRSALTRPTPARTQALDNDIRANQEALMDLIFSRECLRQDVQADPVLVENATSRKGAGKSRGKGGGKGKGMGLRAPPAWVAITTYYATNRAAGGASGGITSYGPERGARVEYGRTEVSVPTARQAGELPLPSLWRLELEPDPSKHFILKRVEPLTGDAMRGDLSAVLASASAKSVLLFVHGFNVTFTDAALRTAQLAHDLAFRGAAMFYSWPSAGKTRSYFRDEEIAQLSEPAFNQVLDDLAAWGVSEIYLIAHSMGSRIVTNVLRERARQNQALPAVSELLLAAPDINEEIFRERIVPALASLQQTRRTIYASANDVALKASKVAHEFRRVGDTEGGVLTFAGYDTVDASAAAPLARAFGHSYVMDSTRVLDDLADILIRRKPIAERGLDRRQASPNNYWLLR